MQEDRPGGAHGQEGTEARWLLLKTGIAERERRVKGVAVKPSTRDFVTSWRESHAMGQTERRGLMVAASRGPRWTPRTYVPAFVAGLCVVLLVVLHILGVDAPLVQGLAFALGLVVLGFSFLDMLVRDIRRTYADPIGERASVLAVMVLETILLFASTYLTISQYPGEIAGLSTPLDSVYFTMTTLMTIGFGDVAAAGQWARGVVLVQMLFTVLLLTSSVRLFSSLVRSMTADAGRSEDTARGDASAAS